MFSARKGSNNGADALWKVLLAFLSAAVLTALFSASPASAFLSSSMSSSWSSSSLSSSPRGAKHAERAAPLYGIKRKVKAEMETNFSGKVVEHPGAETSMFGSDANALFDVIERNKKKAAEAAAAAALAAADADEDEEEREGAEGAEEGGDAA